VGDPRVAEDSPWRVLYLHHEAEELRVHYRRAIPAETVRRVVRDVLGTGRVPPMQGILSMRPPGLHRLILQRLWGTVRSFGGRDYVVAFFDDVCLVAALARLDTDGSGQ
jgi:hypothetical protein